VEKREGKERRNLKRLLTSGEVGAWERKYKKETGSRRVLLLLALSFSFPLTFLKQYLWS
jgi:hypothetical protein